MVEKRSKCDVCEIEFEPKTPRIKSSLDGDRHHGCHAAMMFSTYGILYGK